MLELNQSRSEHSGQRGQRPQIRADGDNLASSRKEHLQYSVQLSLVFLAKAVILVLFCFFSDVPVEGLANDKESGKGEKGKQHGNSSSPVTADSANQAAAVTQ